MHDVGCTRVPDGSTSVLVTEVKVVNHLSKLIVPLCHPFKHSSSVYIQPPVCSEPLPDPFTPIIMSETQNIVIVGGE